MSSWQIDLNVRRFWKLSIGVNNWMMSLKSSFNQEDSLNGSPKMQIIRKRPKPHTSQSRAIKKLFSFEHFDCICIWLFKTNKIKKQTNVMWDSSSNWRHRSKIVTQIKYMLIPFNIIWMLKVQTVFRKHIFKGNFKRRRFEN